MYRIVTRYKMLGLRNEHDAQHNHTHTMMRPIPQVPAEFDTEQDAFNWALSNHYEMRHYPEFVVLPVHHTVLTWQPDDAPNV